MCSLLDASFLLGLLDNVRDEAYDTNPIFSSTSIALLSKSAEHSRRLSAPNRVPNVGPGSRHYPDPALSNKEVRMNSESYEIDALISTLSDDFLGDTHYSDRPHTRPSTSFGSRPATAAGVIKIDGESVVVIQGV